MAVGLDEFAGPFLDHGLGAGEAVFAGFFPDLFGHGGLEVERHAVSAVADLCEQGVVFLRNGAAAAPVVHGASGDAEFFHDALDPCAALGHGQCHEPVVEFCGVHGVAAVVAVVLSVRSGDA